MRLNDPRFNIVVIGGGSAGLMVAAGAAGLGARVALVERGKMGGDCLNYGCVPSKALLSSAHAAACARSSDLGIGPLPLQPGWQPDWQRVAARVQGVVDAIAPHDSLERFASLGVEVVQGSGRLTSRDSVEVTLNAGGTRTLRGRALVIATGSGPLIPPIPGLADVGYLTNESVFTQPDLPRRLAVLGAGPIGLELGQAFARLGSQVTLVEMLPRILPREDPDAAAVLEESLREDGVALRTGMQALRVEAVAGAKRLWLRPTGAVDPARPGRDPGHGRAIQAANRAAAAAEEPLDVDEILVAVGRRANWDGLGLEQQGIVIEHGRIRVDSYLRTSVRSVWACGDVAGPYQFTHMAGQQARVVIQNALLPLKTRMDYRVVPWCTFTDPEVARVGLSEDEAHAAGTPYRTIRIPLSANDRAVCGGDTRGFLKILTPPGRDDILGATLVGAHAGELLHEAVLAMQHRLRLRDLAATVHIYPTLSEVFRRAGDEARKASFTPTVQRLFSAYLRWRRR